MKYSFLNYKNLIQINYFSIRKEFANGFNSIAYSVYTYAREQNSDRSGTFIGSSILYTNKIAKEYDLIIDGTDSFKSKLLISDYCYKNKKILICGAISKFDGHVFVFNFKNPNKLKCF